MKAKRILTSLLIISGISISGCGTKVTNLTPTTLPTNPSGIYTLSAKADIKEPAIDKSTVRAFIAIDGEKHEMTPAEIGSFYFDYDYQVPAGRDEAKFFYIVDYKLNNKPLEQQEPKEITTSVYRLKLINKFPISLDTNRAPVGTQLAVLGRGFTRSDEIFVGGIAAETSFVSVNTLQFVVPNIDPGTSYPVEIRNGKNTSSAGTLKVDPGLPVRVIPCNITVQSGERQALVFALDNPAPTSGLYIDVTTDIPSSVIMPEVIIPEGERTLSISIQGGAPASGSLYIQAPGVQELVIPITVL